MHSTTKVQTRNFSYFVLYSIPHPHLDIEIPKTLFSIVILCRIGSSCSPALCQKAVVLRDRSCRSVFLGTRALPCLRYISNGPQKETLQLHWLFSASTAISALVAGIDCGPRPLGKHCPTEQERRTKDLMI
jgi:hypothetical protein